MKMDKTSSTREKITETQFSISELPTQPLMHNKRAANTRLTTPRIIMNSGKFSSQLHIVGLSWEPHAKFASQRNVYENIMLSTGTESMQDIKNTPAVPAAQTSTLDVGVTDEIEP